MKWKIQFIAWFFSGATSGRMSLLCRLWFLRYQEIDNICTDVDDNRCPLDIFKLHSCTLSQVEVEVKSGLYTNFNTKMVNHRGSAGLPVIRTNFAGTDLNFPKKLCLQNWYELGCSLAYQYR
jgi:hypothetical protein